MVEIKNTDSSNQSWIIKYILYAVAITAIAYRLVDGINEYGIWKALIRTIIIDYMAWIIVLGWFGFIPGISKLNLNF